MDELRVQSARKSWLTERQQEARKELLEFSLILSFTTAETTADILLLPPSI